MKTTPVEIDRYVAHDDFAWRGIPVEDAIVCIAAREQSIVTPLETRCRNNRDTLLRNRGDFRLSLCVKCRTRKIN